MVLITYHFKSYKNPGHEGFHYAISTSATDWIEAMERSREDGSINDGTYVLINALPITDEQATRYDGALQNMTSCGQSRHG